MPSIPGAHPDAAGDVPRTFYLTREVPMTMDVLKYKRLVGSIAVQFSSVADIEDLMQEGFIGLLEASKRFDPDRGVKFTTYAYPWIKKYIREEATRRIKHNTKECELNEEIFGSHPSDRLKALALRECCTEIEGQEKELIAQRYLLGLTLRAIGNQWGVTRERVRQVEIALKRKLKKKLRLKLGENYGTL